MASTRLVDPRCRRPGWSSGCFWLGRGDRNAGWADRSGGAEFRLPLLIGVFGFAALQAVIPNKAMSLIVVLTALPARSFAIPFLEVIDHWTIAVNLLAGSLIGAWLGANWATRMRSATLYRVLAVLTGGDRGDAPICHVVRIRDGLLMEFRMFYWDTVVTNRALARDQHFVKVMPDDPDE